MGFPVLGLKEPEAEVLFDLGRPHIVSTKDEHGKWTDPEEEDEMSY